MGCHSLLQGSSRPKEPKEDKPSHCPQRYQLELRERQGVPSGQGTEASLTQAVVSVVCQHEAVKAGAPVVPRDVDALVDAAPVVEVILTLIDVCKVRCMRSVRGSSGGLLTPHY